MKQRYLVILTTTQGDELTQLIQAGTAPARKHTHARVLLKADCGPDGPGWVDQRIADAVEVSQSTIARIRKQQVEQGLSAALNRRAPRRVYHHKLDGEHEARLIALACSQPPDGQVRCTLRLLADKRAELEIVETISYQTVRRTLKKRPHAAFEKAVVHSARRQRRLCLAHGRRPRRRHPPLRSAFTAGLPG